MADKEQIITKEMVINDIIKKYPTTIGVFNRFNVDSCCGGAKRLKESASGKELEELVAALNEAAR